MEGNIDIQIRDLDQTVIGNPAHDLLRLGLSLAMAARSSDLPGVTTALMLEELILGYTAGLSGRFSKLDSNSLEPITRTMRQAKKRQWRHLAEERIEDVKPEIPLGSTGQPLRAGPLAAQYDHERPEIAVHHIWQMTCPEYERLLQLYEAALRHWGHLLWSAKPNVPSVPMRLVSEMKQRAYVERNESHERLRAHKQTCSVCKSRLRIVSKQ